jgi:uncharacterized membrane protein YuzA (DUF378 family)
MDYLRRLEPLWLALVIIAGLNWAFVALFDWNMVTAIFGSGTVTDVVYCILGFAALMFLPRLLEELRVPTGRIRPTRA